MSMKIHRSYLEISHAKLKPKKVEISFFLQWLSLRMFRKSIDPSCLGGVRQVFLLLSQLNGTNPTSTLHDGTTVAVAVQ